MLYITVDTPFEFASLSYFLVSNPVEIPQAITDDGKVGVQVTIKLSNPVDINAATIMMKRSTMQH